MKRKGLFLALAVLFLVSGFANGQTGSAKPAPQVIPGQPTELLQLDDVVREALEQNPAIHAALHTVAAQRARVPQASALPDPTLGVGWMGNIQPFSVQTGDPSSYRSVSAMQMLPYPGQARIARPDRLEGGRRAASGIWRRFAGVLPPMSKRPITITGTTTKLSAPPSAIAAC